ncbi:unnamed protein product [Protopolystoma xenopodis]|uniref:long-chain-fatty-acid--CoA ligase n=1 Tax=Protopolystoma xenopodis TaxID=117903 RepID=A0A3S5B4M7_9PLAT|nr:unnamed protein product [Protopolystoma xenopodis]
MLDEPYYRKLRSDWGGRIEFLITGSAFLPKEIFSFLRAAFNCTVIEGYGATETGGPVTVTLAHETRGEVVGPPATSCRIKLADVPDMALVAFRDNKGEVN